MLSASALKSFKEIYRAEYGEDIPDAQASELALNLLTLYDHIYRPLKKEWLARIPIGPTPPKGFR